MGKNDGRNWQISYFQALMKEKRNQIIDDFSEEEVNYLNEHGAILYEGIEETLEILSKKI